MMREIVFYIAFNFHPYQIGKRYILIPAKNEVNTVGKVVSAIKARFAISVVVIDDASTDNTASVARAAGAIVLPLPFSLGAWGRCKRVYVML